MASIFFLYTKLEFLQIENWSKSLFSWVFTREVSRTGNTVLIFQVTALYSKNFHFLPKALGNIFKLATLDSQINFETFTFFVLFHRLKFSVTFI